MGVRVAEVHADFDRRTVVRDVTGHARELGAAPRGLSDP